ncbi:hypothetical protein CHS0354_031069, partial [Potamilus streckersoni]
TGEYDNKFVNKNWPLNWPKSDVADDQRLIDYYNDCQGYYGSNDVIIPRDNTTADNDDFIDDETDDHYYNEDFMESDSNDDASDTDVTDNHCHMKIFRFHIRSISKWFSISDP